MVTKMEEFSKEKFYKDILFMFDKIKSTHPNIYYRVSESELNSLIDNYMKDDSINTFESSIYYLSSIFARIGDSHTELISYYSPSLFKFRIINNEVVVSESYDERVLPGSILETINGISVNQIISELIKITTPRTSEGVIGEVEVSLNNKGVLGILPSIKQSASIDYCFNVNGNKVNINEEIGKTDYTKYKYPKYYEYSIVDGVVVIKYRKCRNEEELPFKDFVEEIKSILNVDGYVVDLRGNGGGNSSIIEPLVEFLRDKKVVTLVDNKVFSSGIMACVDLKNIGSEIVGTHLAENLNSFGEVLIEESPNYKLKFSHSKKYFSIYEGHYSSLEGKEKYDDFFSHEENKKYLEPISINPDVYLDVTKEDLINNTDSVLEYAVSSIKEMRL